MSFEDRMYEADKDGFEAIMKKLEKAKRKPHSQRREIEHDAYDWFTNHGASPEEADEFINLVLEY